MNDKIESPFDQLDEGLLKRITTALKDAFTKSTSKPVRIAVIGETGVGKTSTINALFNTNLPVSHFGSCTQQAEIIKVSTPKGELEIIDMPGLWAGEAETIRHWQTYREIIPKVDSVIWIISAGDRALEGMQNALKTISQFSDRNIIDRVAFGINKCEHMHPEDWNSNNNLPSLEQVDNLNRFSVTVKNAINEAFPSWTGNIIWYSAKKQFRLDELLEQMIILASMENRIKIAKVADTKRFEDKVADTRSLHVAQGIINERNE
jgi:hypothetical protein